MKLLKLKGFRPAYSFTYYLLFIYLLLSTVLLIIYLQQT